MKNTCGIFLAIMFGAAAGYYYLFRGTELAELYWVPAVLGLGAAIVFSNLYGISLALRQRRAVSRPRSHWKNGEYVGISGRIGVSGPPLKAPFSRVDAAIVEYNIKRREMSSGSRGSSSHTRTVSDCYGFMMAPCSVQARQGSAKLVGFPMLTHIGEHVYGEDEESDLVTMEQNAAAFLAGRRFKRGSSNPMTLLKELSSVLNDQDGKVDEHFCTDVFEHVVGAVPESDGEREGAESSGADAAEQQGPNAAERIAAVLRQEGYFFEESIVKNGEEVTVFGTFDAKSQLLNIGSQFKNLAHGLHLGPAEKVCGRALRNSVLASLFWLAAFAAGNVYVLKLIGIDLLQGLNP